MTYRYPDDEFLLFLGIMAFLYPVLAWMVFPVAPMFIFRERAFGVLLPFFYILLARIAGKLPWKWMLPVFTLMACGFSWQVTETFYPTVIKYRTLSDARSVARYFAQSCGPHDTMRGSPDLDGITLFEYMEHAVPTQNPVNRLFFLATSPQDIHAFLGKYPVKPIYRKNAVLVYLVK